MTDQMRGSWPLPPMDEMPDEACDPCLLSEANACANTAGEAGVVGAPPHDMFTQANVRAVAEIYADHRRAHAEAIGRPYPEARHPVWPR